MYINIISFFNIQKLEYLLSFVGIDSNISVIRFDSLRRNAIINAAKY